MMKVFILRINKNNIEQYSSYYVCSNKKQALNLFKKIYASLCNCLFFIKKQKLIRLLKFFILQI